MAKYTEQDFKHIISGKLSRYFGVTPMEATREQLYQAIASGVRDLLIEKHRRFHTETKSAHMKRVYYLCMEFLLGRSLKNNVYNLGIEDALLGAMKGLKLPFTLEELYEEEPDAGLGNGGLGRLAACFLDALATQDYPAMGFSICYEYGLFKQKIVDGWQIEMPDVWLPGGECWLFQRTDKQFTVRFDGEIEEKWTSHGMETIYKNATEVEATAYDMMVSGKDSKAVSVLRLWRSRAENTFDMDLFSRGDYQAAMRFGNEAELISKVLYPSDNHIEGKSLRLRQQYFLVSASLQCIISDHKRRYGSLMLLPQLAAIHINDTHPALAIPELMRILVDENCLDWDTAWALTTSCIAYTNHTVLSEALETWQESLVARILPRIHSILKEINRRFCEDLWKAFPGDWNKISRMSILSHGLVRMANLCIHGAHSVNGVSELHGKIIKESVFSDFNDYTPQKFSFITNGIAHRRWLDQSNPALFSLLQECIGDGFVKDAEKLQNFARFENDDSVLRRLGEIKRENKCRLSDYVRKTQGILLDPDTIFDVQAKRMHEYKRQLLNALHIIEEYNMLKEDPSMDFVPKTYLFAAKAAAGYDMAKQIIKLICYLSEDIASHEEISKKLKVVFLENYNVTMSEKLMPATEISEQISLCGKEASGTGNMKFMLGGALTIGTLDGANVEMTERVGQDNIFIFGLTAEEVSEIWKGGYNSSAYYNRNPEIRKVIESLIVGFNGCSFAEISNYLLRKSPVADPYMCLCDFESYSKTQRTLSNLYQTDKRAWNKKSLHNIAAAGYFSADRCVREYADKIWGLSPLKK